MKRAKLTIKPETIRLLQSADLTYAAGGGSTICKSFAAGAGPNLPGCNTLPDCPRPPTR